MNAAAMRMLGIESADADAAGYFSFVLDCARGAIKASRNQQSEGVVQHSIHQPDGGIRSLIIRIPLPGYQEGSRRIILTITDASELADRETRLRRADKMIESSNDGIVLLSKDYNIISINPAFSTMTGYKLEQLLDQSISAILASPGRLATRREPVRAQLHTQGFYSGETEFIREDGSSLAILLSTSVLRDDHAGPSG